MLAQQYPSLAIAKVHNRSRKKVVSIRHTRTQKKQRSPETSVLTFADQFGRRTPLEYFRLGQQPFLNRSINCLVHCFAPVLNGAPMNLFYGEQRESQ
jgi:hypothetical protein